MLEPLRVFYPDLPDGVLAHHERWDGKGYPRGLKGRRIPLSARVVAIADTFDAITHGRPYRTGQPAAVARKVLIDGRGAQFDPDLVDLFLFPPVYARVANAVQALEDWEAPGAEATHEQRGRERPRHHLPLASRASRIARAASVGSDAPNSALITATPAAPADSTVGYALARDPADRDGGQSAPARQLAESHGTDRRSRIRLAPRREHRPDPDVVRPRGTCDLVVAPD